MKSLCLLFAVLILISSCSNKIDPDYDADYNTVQSLYIKEAISLINDWKYSKPEITSFITTKELKIIFPDDREVAISLPENEMYVAIAPYIAKTHSCSIHYLSSCQGEMINKEFKISITNEQSREIIFDGTVKTMKNGFFEIWLPRNARFNCIIQYQDKSTEFYLDSFEDSNTCVTTVKIN